MGYKTIISEKLAETYLVSSPQEPPKEKEARPSKKPLVLAAALLGVSGVLIITAVSLFTIRNITIDVSINEKGRFLLENLLYTASPGLVGSSILEDTGGERYAVLVDDGTKRRAALVIDLKEPVDFSRRFLLINSMPKRGGGRLRVILRDEGFRSYISNTLDVRGVDDIYENFIVSAQDTSRTVNIKRINQIRLELEKDRTKPGSGSCVYIKSVGIAAG